MMLRTLDTGTLFLAGSCKNPYEFERGTIAEDNAFHKPKGVMPPFSRTYGFELQKS